MFSLKPCFASLLSLSCCSPQDVKYFLQNVYRIWEGNKGKSFLAKFIDGFVSMLEELGGLSQVKRSTFSIAEVLHQLHLDLT